MNSTITLLTTKELCQKYGLLEDTLIKQRHLKKGIPFTKIGSSIFYIEEVFKKWLIDNLQSCDYKIID